MGRSSSSCSFLIVVALLLINSALASQVFYASAVSYCSNARAIEVDKFLLEYNNEDKTVSFDISAASVESNLGAVLSLQLEAYGIDAVNTSINLCDELGGLLCPLPVYDFVASATLPLPSLVQNSVNVPGIGYKIPDLEATAYVRLLRVTDGSEAVCLKVDLSNGKSVRFVGVSWALGGLALGALLVGFLRGLVALLKGDIDTQLERGRGKERLLQIMSFYQFVASTGVLSIDYPIIYDSFTANFAWTIGLIRMQPFQVEIDEMRNRTGGNLTQTAGTLVGGTLARNNVLAAASNSYAVNSNITSVSHSLMSNLAAAHQKSSGIVRRALDTAAQAYTVPEVQETDVVNAVRTGIPHYTTVLNISPFNAYMTVFFNFLLLLCIFVIVLIIAAIPFLVVLRIVAKRRGEKGGLNPARGMFASLVRANALRMLLISWFPLLVFTFYQWTLGRADSWAPIVISVFAFLFTTASILFLAIRTLLLVRRTSRDAILANGGGPYTPLWNTFKPSRWWFFLPLLIATVLRAIFIAFARNHGWVQTVALVAIEFIVFVSMCIFTPFNDKSSNGMNITIQILRCIISGALIVFNRSIGLNEIIRVAVGAVIAVISSVVVIFLFILLLIDLVALIIFLFRSTKRRRNSAAPKMDMLEAGETQHQYGAYGHHPIENGAGAEAPMGRSSLTLAEEEQRLEAERAKNGGGGGMAGREEHARI
ncbi:hypothetical protein BCR35DRAFT_311286 [Leucosporidium creatinivorum]|uniref:ML-like domain-containing protein n=1 Tax=Leucosporidium creatinivorum TaxID=106004 RepID=A0A1Y2C537_9BASI|nr:hypothetical protein BCR35DRAFT_311286 [Leucosporidium creatinivorum]